MKNWLLNLTGWESHFTPVDLVMEHIIGWIKDLVQ